MENNKKRYYKIGETVWMKKEKRFGIVKELNIKPSEKKYELVIEEKINNENKTMCVNVWDVDKDKRTTRNKKLCDTVLFAKVRNTAILPSFINVDASYDIYVDIKNPVLNPKGKSIKDPVNIQPNEVVFLPTGIASSLLSKYRFALKENNDSSSCSLSVLSGIIDANYREEWFIAIHNSGSKNVILTSSVNEIIETNEHIYFPATKAIAKAVIEICPKVRTKEVTYEQLCKIPTFKMNQSSI
ncbi:hypothetical protein [Paenibacillus alvei]|uniref:Uncharacterized protein n=1 Tax=Paenibacillus alvei TaxID=44250 RepID=A0AAP7DL67_PAEAL|nr:hypothetical protein [Paenibacillus alvei]NEZ45051.1 hypothetical protein [Paenibacillus alvei]NOJ73765.1 hypothetical protein [Paenibacillus alvei]